MAAGFGKRLRQARIAQGLNQGDLAKKVDVSQATISFWETGHSTPNSGQRKKLERILGIARTGQQQNAHDSEEQEGGPGAFGEWLRKVRTKKDMTVPELAWQSKLSPMAIYNIESGKSLNPWAKTKVRLAEALGVEIPMEVREEAEQEQSIVGLGSLIDFNPHDKREIPATPGVYVFYDVSERPIYVGEGQNIADRVKDHEEKFWFKRPIVTNAAFVKISDKALRRQVEQVLIKFLKSNAVINKEYVDR